jgi:hypothetical protein
MPVRYQRLSSLRLLRGAAIQAADRVPLLDILSPRRDGRTVE